VSFVSAHSSWDFVNRAAKSQGIPDLGWRVIEEAVLGASGRWASHVVQAPTLRDAIAALAYWYPKEVPIVRTGLADGGDHAWLWRVRLVNLHGCPGDELVEQYTLGRLVKIVRLVAGKEWIPTHVKLESRREDSMLPPCTLHGAQIRYGEDHVAIAVPWDMLDQSLPRPEPMSSAQPPPGNLENPRPGFAGSLRQLLAPLVFERSLSLGLAADLAGTSERTLRRRLAEEDCSWRHVLEDLHRDASLPMLNDLSIPIGEIAQALGYSDHAHFTRAFQRWTGQTPSAFRHERSCDDCVLTERGSRLESKQEPRPGRQ
jgi:AraC-like DNA-binding protein